MVTEGSSSVTQDGSHTLLVLSDQLVQRYIMMVLVPDAIEPTDEYRTVTDSQECRKMAEHTLRNHRV